MDASEKIRENVTKCHPVQNTEGHEIQKPPCTNLPMVEAEVEEDGGNEVDSFTSTQDPIEKLGA